MKGRRFSEVWLAGPALVLVLPVAACSATTGSEQGQSSANPLTNISPTDALHSAIAALEDEARYRFIVTTNPGGIPSGPAVDEVAIQRPDRISITGSRRVVAIGSTGYLKEAGVWTTVHHQGESANFTNDELAYVNLLKRATSVARAGNAFTVPATEAAALLASTGLPPFQHVTNVSYTATVASGVLRSVSLRLDNAQFPPPSGTSPFSVTVNVTELANSPDVTVPSGA